MSFENEFSKFFHDTFYTWNTHLGTCVVERIGLALKIILIGMCVYFRPPGLRLCFKLLF